MGTILYSTNCPRCNILKTKLNKKEIPFSEENDIDVMIEKGFTEVPMLEVDGEIMNFSQANTWINNMN